MISKASEITEYCSTCGGDRNAKVEWWGKSLCKSNCTDVAEDGHPKRRHAGRDTGCPRCIPWGS